MEQIKLLGVYINENLSLADHISNLCTRARRNVGVPVHVWNLIPCNAKLTSYNSAILPHLTYWHLVCNFCKSSESRKIVRVQEGVLWAIYKSQVETYKELLACAKLPTLYNRHLQDTATLMYKVKNNLVPSCLSQLFKTKKSQYYLVLGYRLYTTDIYKILPLWCIRLKTILFQAAYHNYSKLRSRNTTWCWATDSIQQTSTRYCHSDV